MQVVWEYGSNHADNRNNFDTIRQWWQSLEGKEVTWQQRVLPTSRNLEDIDWERQRFDETLVLAQPQIRGITLYWQKTGDNQEKNTTPRKLILDTKKQQLYVYPQSQENLVVRVAIPQVPYQTYQMNNPECEGSVVSGRYLLTLRDSEQLLEVKVTLEADALYQLKQQLP
ncbi:hypothetical protein [Geitlerinema sp. PCC 9228]|jgi:hypothetical protein|uniref:hypothetical protein n=1 Tax=Geitlerinema sp. PCC 9228 TaxID=111611 RepID=UPI0008F98735|nr:hypothetical protein [Geitlerinema sp. PCC 9228]